MTGSVTQYPALQTGDAVKAATAHISKKNYYVIKFSFQINASMRRLFKKQMFIIFL